MGPTERATASQRIGGFAAIANGVFSLLHLVMVTAVLDPGPAYASPDAVDGAARAAITTAAQWLVPEVLRLLSAACLLVLVYTMRVRMAARTAPNLRAAMLSGFAGSALYSLSALLGIFAIAQASRAGLLDAGRGAVEALVDAATYLGLFAFLAYGIWYLLTASAAMRRGGMPLRLAYLTFLLGAVNVLAFLLPPLAVLVLLIGSVWSVALGFFLLREPTRYERGGNDAS